MRKTKITEVEDGLTSAAIAVGSALGNLAKKVGLAKAETKSPVPAKKAVSRKKAAPRKKAAVKKIVKKVNTKGTGLKKGTRPAKKK